MSYILSPLYSRVAQKNAIFDFLTCDPPQSGAFSLENEVPKISGPSFDGAATALKFGHFPEFFVFALLGTKLKGLEENLF